MANFFQNFNILRVFRGSFKTPLLYLGIVLIILIILTSFFSHQARPKIKDLFSDSKSTLNRDRSFLFSSQLIKESPDLSFIQKNSLVAISPPILVTPQVLGAILGGRETELESKKEVREYLVESGDTLWSIAEKFNISLNTLLWSNDLSSNSIIKPGQKLIILPVSGVIHQVKTGDTLSKISQTYKAKIEEIIAFNELSAEGDIFIGDILIIPNGRMPPKSPPVQYAPLAVSYFICPISPPCRISQGLHWYNAVDFSHGKCQELIMAAAGGEVLKVKFGWNQGAGNYLTILHPNGVVTMYGHLSTILVNPGDQVSQGQIIALMGGQPGTPGAGRSTGCHLHFGVIGAKNPFAK